MFLHRQFPKTGLKVKLTAFLLMVSLFQVQANSYAQKTKLSLDLEGASIGNIFNEDRRDFGISVFVRKRPDRPRTENIPEGQPEEDNGRTGHTLCGYRRGL